MIKKIRPQFGLPACIHFSDLCPGNHQLLQVMVSAKGSGLVPVDCSLSNHLDDVSPVSTTRRKFATKLEQVKMTSSFVFLSVSSQLGDRLEWLYK